MAIKGSDNKDIPFSAHSIAVEKNVKSRPSQDPGKGYTINKIHNCTVASYDYTCEW